MRTKFHLIALLAIVLSACAGAADTSKSYSRAVINRGAIVPAETIRLHEYLNYYDQTLPGPTDEALALDVRLGNPTSVPPGGILWLQIGLQAREIEAVGRTPLNLALVLDTSGSMDAADKMPYLKSSLRLFLESLKPEDRVAIVAYSDRAQVIHQSSLVGDGYWIQQAVDRLHPSGRTNLHAGLMKGFSEVDRHFDRRRNNRVLLLTDGIANRGVTNPDRIAAEAERYNNRGIQLSTVGLGLDLNDQLLSTLAHQGRGVYHFIDSAAEMDKVFRQEVDGLVERVAREVVVSIEVDPGVELVEVVGAEWQPSQAAARLRVQDMGAGDSQILLAKLRLTSVTPGLRTVARIGVSYLDAFAEREEFITKPVMVSVSGQGRHDPLVDWQVQRNVTIVQSARALIEVDHLFEAGRYEEAWRVADSMEQELRYLAMTLEDPQLAEDADLFARYRLTLASALGYEPSAHEDSELPRWSEDWQEESLPTIEVR